MPPSHAAIEVLHHLFLSQKPSKGVCMEMSAPTPGRGGLLGQGLLAAPSHSPAPGTGLAACMPADMPARKLAGVPARTPAAVHAHKPADVPACGPAHTLPNAHACHFQPLPPPLPPPHLHLPLPVCTAGDMHDMKALGRVGPRENTVACRSVGRDKDVLSSSQTTSTMDSPSCKRITAWAKSPRR